METSLNKKHWQELHERGPHDCNPHVSTTWCISGVVLALIELRESIDKHFERLPDMIEGLALAMTDQADKIIVELQKDVLRLQTQIAGMDRLVASQGRTISELAQDIKSPAAQIQDLAIAVEEIQYKIR